MKRTFASMLGLFFLGFMAVLSLGSIACGGDILGILCQRGAGGYDTRSSHPVASGAFAGDWHWVRSPEQERRVVVALYNRYCVRCHGVDGKGVWDIPDVPDFTNLRWQQCRTDEQLVRLTIEGRGACMPAFRGTLSIEETWAMARYLRTFAYIGKSEDLGASQPSAAKASDSKTSAPKSSSR